MVKKEVEFCFRVSRSKLVSLGAHQEQLRSADISRQEPSEFEHAEKFFVLVPVQDDTASLVTSFADDSPSRNFLFYLA